EGRSARGSRARAAPGVAAIFRSARIAVVAGGAVGERRVLAYPAPAHVGRARAAVVAPDRAAALRAGITAAVAVAVRLIRVERIGAVVEDIWQLVAVAVAGGGDDEISLAARFCRAVGIGAAAALLAVAGPRAAEASGRAGPVRGACKRRCLKAASLPREHGGAGVVSRQGTRESPDAGVSAHEGRRALRIGRAGSRDLDAGASATR